MTYDNSIDRTKVTFSQAEGLEPLPSPLALGELSSEARSLIWHVIYESLEEDGHYPDFGGEKYISGKWKSLLYAMHVVIDFNPADEFGTGFRAHNNRLKKLIMEGELNKIFDFLTFVMRHGKSPHKLSNDLKWTLRQSRTAYKIIDDGPTIIPCATEEEGEAITIALALTEKTGFSGARTHLRGAADSLNKGDFSGCVRESIHAVESVACRLNEDASTILGPALSTLEKSITIHPALKSGFSSIYGYTSDQEGIRHALLEGKADVDIIDATFMFGACASFVTYLINKARQSGIAVD